MTQDWDPFDPDALRDPLSTHAELRAHCPVAYTERAGGFCALFKYDDIVAAARDPQTYSSALTSRTALRRQIPLESDPPEHTAYHRFLQTYFGPARLEMLDAVVRVLLHQRGVAGIDDPRGCKSTNMAAGERSRSPRTSYSTTHAGWRLTKTTPL